MQLFERHKQWKWIHKSTYSLLDSLISHSWGGLPWSLSCGIVREECLKITIINEWCSVHMIKRYKLKCKFRGAKTKTDLSSKLMLMKLQTNSEKLNCFPSDWVLSSKFSILQLLSQISNPTTTETSCSNNTIIDIHWIFKKPQ